MHVSVIISTYNEPQWLQKVLWGYEQQTHTNFDIIIADDGSGTTTTEMIAAFKEQSRLEIHHLWHPDNGYRKCEILNKAVQYCTSPYIIFTDGDCIPHPDFVRTHGKFARTGTFLSGGAMRLPMSTSQRIDLYDIRSGRAFNVRWLIDQGLPDKPLKNLKLVCHEHGLDSLLNSITPTKATWNGGNASTWRRYILACNGFDERMQYGGQDREFGERLINLGIQGKQLRYSAICLHLEHSRSYKNQNSIDRNLAIRRETRTTRKTRTETGILKFTEL
jgi:glycosyltransferase involved in cell wall biosynthesis